MNSNELTRAKKRGSFRKRSRKITDLFTRSGEQSQSKISARKAKSPTASFFVSFVVVFEPVEM
jgi:hypothetical protein